MLRALVNAFKVPDLRNKIFFTLFIIAVYRFGSHVPVPVVDIGRLQDALAGQGAGGFLNFIDLFSGGALTRMAVEKALPKVKPWMLGAEPVVEF